MRTNSNSAVMEYNLKREFRGYYGFYTLAVMSLDALSLADLPVADLALQTRSRSYTVDLTCSGSCGHPNWL